MMFSNLFFWGNAEFSLAQSHITIRSCSLSLHQYNVPSPSRKRPGLGEIIEVTHLANIRVRPRISPRHIDHAHSVDIIWATIQTMLWCITFSTSFLTHPPHTCILMLLEVIILQDYKLLLCVPIILSSDLSETGCHLIH